MCSVSVVADAVLPSFFPRGVLSSVRAGRVWIGTGGLAIVTSLPASNSSFQESAIISLRIGH